jgi:DNA polymerase-4
VGNLKALLPILIFVLLLPVAGYTQEASPWVFDFGLESGEVQLEWQGYWKLRGGWGTAWSTENGVTTWPAFFPGMQEGFSFTQEPDLLLTLWILDRYYLEINFVEDYTRNTYAMGYRGKEGEILQSARIGNSGIAVSGYQGLEIPLPEYNTPGASLLLQTARADHEFLIRFDPSGTREKLFIGTSEVAEEVIFPGDYISGRYFMLPDAAIAGVSVWSEDRNGNLTGSDGRRYRQLVAGEFAVDLSEGTLALAVPAEGRILVWYTAGGPSVGTSPVAFIVPPGPDGHPNPSATPEPFGWSEDDSWDPDPVSGPRTFAETRQVTVSGFTALVLYDPGRFSPFERPCFYTVHETMPENDLDGSVFVRDRGNPDDESVADFNFLLNRIDLSLFVAIDGESVRSPRSRYPFSDRDRALYGPARITVDELCSRELVIQVKRGDSGFNLGPEVVPGSVSVTVNGVADPTVTYDTSSGTLRFHRFIYPDDRIIVTYRIEGELLDGGELFIVQGNRFRISDNWKAELAFSLRWKISADRVTDEPGESPGALTMVTSVGYSGKGLSWDLRGKALLSTPDTTGTLRLADMESTGSGQPLYSDILVPPPVLDPLIVDGLDPSTVSWSIPPHVGFTEIQAGNQTYLHDYAWSGAVIDPEKTGPSAAASRSGDPFGGNVAVVVFDLDGNDFTAGDILQSEEKPADCSGYTGIRFYLTGWNRSGTVRVLFQAGELGESSDHDDNGFTDPVDYGYLMTRDITASLSAVDGEWTSVEIPFTDDERSRLTRCRGIRILVEESSGAADPASGRILTGGFRWTGSPLLLSVRDSFGNTAAGSVSARETDDPTLEQAYSDIDDLFHFDGGDQRVAVIAWNGIGTVNRWTGTRYITPVRVNDYEKAVLYVKQPAGAGTCTMTLADADGKGVRVVFIPGSTGWEKLSVNMVNGTAILSGGSIVSCSVDRNAGELIRFTLEGTGLDSGSLYVDELHFTDPLFSLSGTLYTRLRVDKGEPFLTAPSGVVLGQNFFAETNLTGTGGSVLSEGAEGTAALAYQAASGVDLLMTRLEGQIDGLAGSHDSWAGGGHLVRFPAAWEWGWISDSYKRSYNPSDPSFSRANQLRFNVPELGFASFKAEASSTGSVITQNWGADTEWVPVEGLLLTGRYRIGQAGLWTNDSGGSYAADWARDWNLLLPSEGETRRDTSQSLDLNWSGRLFEVRWNPSLKSLTTLTGVPSQEDRWASLLSGSFHVFFKEIRILTLSAGYIRNLMCTHPTNGENGFRGDYGRMGESLREAWPLTHFVPFSELFDPGLLDVWSDMTADQSRSEYAPVFYIEAKRKPFSRWSDLVVPSSFKSEFRRTLSRNADTVSSVDIWRFTLTHSANNLFGSFGVHPVLMFYNSDQIISSLQFQLEGKNGAAPGADTLAWQLFLSAEGNRGMSLTLDNRLDWQINDPLVSEQCTAAFVWKTPGKELLRIPFSKMVLKRNHYLKNDEKITISGDFPGTGFEGSEEFRLIVTVTHETRLVIDGIGSAGFWFSFGTGRETERTDVGLELGLEVLIQF